MITPGPFLVTFSILIFINLPACQKEQTNDFVLDNTKKIKQNVVVYTSIDEPFAKQILQKFEEESGIDVDVVFDSEAGKTTGFLQRIRLEKDHPRADVFFSSEIFGTIQLAKEGLLQPYNSPAASDIPPRFRDKNNLWTAIGLRGRVLAFNPNKVKTSDLPSTWEEIALPEFAPHTAWANPLFGTTRGHVACMFSLWGQEKSMNWLKEMVNNKAVLSDSNSATIRALTAGEVLFAMTDTDDVLVARKKGANIEMIYPAFKEKGTLFIPCTAAMIKDCKRPEAAKKLIDFLLSAKIEKLLAQTASGNIPVRESIREELGMSMPPLEPVSYDDISSQLNKTDKAVRDIVIR